MTLFLILKRFGRRLLPALAAVALILTPATFNASVTAAGNPDGIVCTTNPNDFFDLTTQTGSIQTPDGNTVYMWSYSESGKPFQYPGPVLCVTAGDTVTVVLHNSLPVKTSLMFPSLEGVLANGSPAQPEFDGSGVMTSLTTTAAANSGSITYSFVAQHPGTYIYESGTDAEFQTQMGLVGVLVVYPAGNTAQVSYAYDGSWETSRYNPATEFLVLLSEVDPTMHLAIQNQMTAGSPVSFDMSQYVSRYWLLNGRVFPDTIAPNYASWLPAQPYGGLARIHPYDPVNNPYPALERYVNVGPKFYPFHPHGANGRVIGLDGNPLRGGGGEDLSYEKYSLNIGPGQTLETTFKWENVEGYDSVTRQVPVTLPGEQNLTYGQYYSGSPYLGNPQPLPPGNVTYNQCGEYYHVAHNHDLSTITAWGLTMSGMMTYTRIDPPLPNNCP